MTTVVLLGVGLGAFGVSMWWAVNRFNRSRWLQGLAKVVASMLILAGLAPGAYLLWSASGDRSAKALSVTSHIAYGRMVIDGAVAHWATIDLVDGAGCIEPVVSKPAANGLIAAQTATGFVSDTSADLAVNVAFFRPIREYPHWASYPKVGDEITALGYAVGDGTHTGAAWKYEMYVMIRPADGSVEIGQLPERQRSGLWAVPGRRQLVVDGEVPLSEPGKRYPRTAIGIDRDNGHLHLVVVDGKQPGYSPGLTLPALARELIVRGVDEAVEFDGGGSSTMAATINGEVTLLSRPSHTRIPGRERPVATFLGFQDSCR